MSIQTYREEHLGHQPAHQALSYMPGADRMFITVHHAITDQDIAAHVAGRITLAVPPHCCYGHHAYDDQRPSLAVQPAKKARSGRHAANSHAPGCLFASEHGQVMDVFRVLCRLEGLIPAEGSNQLCTQLPEVRAWQL